MTNTKRALLSSVMALFICFAMLLGTTFAWFTDSVTSAGNIIQSGTLDIEMYWAKGTEDPSSADWKDASQGAIFNSELWEPGYVEARHIKIANVGTLALKYKLAIAPNGEVSELADVIDVYFVDPAQIATRDSLAALTPVGTLRQMIDDPDGAAYGSLLAEDESTEEIESVKTVTIALKMREDAGNEYQNLSIGTNFSIVLMATQDNVEKDAFDENYDDIEIPDKDVQVIEGNIYHYTVDGNVVLASVPYGNVGASFTVRNDVTLLGIGVDKDDTNGPVFSKYSPVETLTLNEGLVKINARAVTGVKTLTSVNFPSTLKFIGEQAFAQAGMTSLTIPANVEEIKFGAFRDMANLTTVTVAGNVVFDDYAFRSCPNLTSIYLLGDDVTFAGGQFATHSDNGDATGITIYVKNATVAARVYDAQANAYGYKVKILGDAADGSDATEVAQANNATQLDAAIANGASTILLGSGNYTFPASNIKAGTTIICEDGTVFDGATSLNINGATVVGATFTSNNAYLVYQQTINGTFKDCVFTNSYGLYSCIAGEIVVFENCVFDTDFYGVHFDSGKNDVVFKGCTFTGFNTFGAALTKLTMEDCTFKYNGKGGYNGINLWGDTDLINCTFVFDGSSTYEWIDLCSGNKTANFKNCVVSNGTTTSNVSTLIGDKLTKREDSGKIIVDGVELTY